MTGQIHAWLQPAFFISYSRHQSTFAAAVRTALSSAGVRTVWFDQDRIQIGDDWRAEIEIGIRRCDELVLLLSSESAASREVAAEVDLAVRLGKNVRPILIERLTRPSPAYVSRFQYLDISGWPQEKAVAAVARHLGSPTADAVGMLDLKLAACRGLHPAFSEGLLGDRGGQRTQATLAELEGLLSRYPESSAIWLNAGLTGCLAGAWDQGLERLRAYARAVASFPGWYFLAAHLPRRQLVLGTPRSIVREALDAIERALAVCSHPLALLTAAILETGGANYGPAHLERRMQAFAAALALKEEPSEVKRLYWCLQPSFRVLGRFESPVRAVLKELCS
jgi:hypothetical protein